MPDGMRGSDTGGRLEVRWDVAADDAFWLILVASFIFAIGGTYTLRVLGVPEVAMMVVITAGVVALFALQLTLSTRKAISRLCVDGERVLLEPGRGRKTEMPLARLRLIKVSTALGARVILLGEREAIICRVGDSAQAHWLRAALERSLLRGPGRRGPR